MPDRSLTENVVVVGAVVVVVIAVVVECGFASAPNASAITDATTSKPPLTFMIPFIFDYPFSRAPVAATVLSLRLLNLCPSE